MERLGKRQQRDSSESDDSQEEEDYYQSKRQRHDSDSEQYSDDEIRRNAHQIDDDDELQGEDEPHMTEEQRLWLEAQHELLKEDQMFKNMSKEEIQRILAEDNNVEEVKHDKASIRKMINSLKQKLNENLEKRIQHQAQPEGFMDSEGELHAALKEIQMISAFPQSISEFIKLEGVQLLIEILDHQNPDILVESITLLVELSDEEVQEQKVVIKIMVQNEIWNFLQRILQKLDDNEEDERKHIFKCLQLLENLLDAEPELMSNKIMHLDPLVEWMVLFLNQADCQSENYLQIAELLAIIVQNAHSEYKEKFVATLQGMEKLLAVLNKYRRDKKLETEEELEAIANVFDTLSALLLVQENLDTFRKLQAFELLLNLCKKQKLFRRHIIKVFDYTLSPAAALLDTRKNCKYFVEQAKGLPVVFAFLMLKQDVTAKVKKSKLAQQLYVKVTADDIQDDEKHILNILAGLLVNSVSQDQNAGQVLHERVLFKFIENDFEKLQRMFELHLKYQARVQEFDLSQFKEEEEINYLVQDYGFEVLELIDFIIGFLHQSQTAVKLSEGDPIDLKIKEFMKLNGIKMVTVKEVIRIHIARTGLLQQQEGDLIKQAKAILNEMN